MATIGQTRIDQQIFRLALTPASVWNAAAPVSRLPPEILACIFVYCARRHYHENWDDTGVPVWVSVSYVCSRWRRVALNCPTLWGYMFVVSPHWTDASLIRSKEVPLRVCVYFSPLHRNPALEFMEQVTPHMERFRECRTDLQSDGAEIVLPMWSSRSAPLLHTLTITFRHFPYYWNEVDVDDTTQAVNAYTLFNGDTPVLRDLHLREYLTSWCSPTLGGLTVLRLRNLHYSVRPTIAELRAILNCVPDLELLTSRTFVRFLSSIDIPATTQVRLRCRLETRTNAYDYALFYALLSQRFNDCENEATSVAPIRTMVIVDNSPRHTFIIFSASGRTCGRRRCNSSLYQDCDCDTPLKVDIDWPPHTEHWNDLVVGICRNVSLVRLRNLILDRCHLRSALWFDIFWHLGELRYIELIGSNFSDILLPLSLSSRLLPENADRPMDQRTSQLFAPSLEDLYLNGVKIPRNYRCGGNPGMHGSHVTLFREALAQRRATDHALILLLINGSFSFSQRKVVHLEQVVSKVGVHKFTRLLPDDESSEDCVSDASEE